MSLPRTLVACFVALLVGACATSPAVQRGNDAPRIVDVATGRFVREAQLVDALVAAPFRLLGERHDNPAHHDLRARLVAAIAAAGRRPAVVFEPFDREHDGPLQAAQVEGANADSVAEAGRLDRKGWRWPLHRPIVEAALSARLPLRAGNLSRARLRERMRQDVSESSLFPGLAWSAAQQALLVDAIVEGHCGKLPPETVPRIVIAQRLRDDAMARALLDSATADGAILIAGNGHVRSDVGVAAYLRARRPDARIVSVGFIEVGKGRMGPETPGNIVARNPGFDYLWLTDTVARDDPCGTVAAMPAR